MTRCSRFGRRMYWGWAALMVMAAAGWAQEEARREILVDLNVNYRLAYRDSSWVPVDVIVRNTLRDIEGRVEVRLSAYGEVQSPVYTAPLDSPEGSKKRFRLYCHFAGTTRVEAMVYDGRRPVLAAPFFLDLQPIRDQDLLGLVLDDEPMDYSFLNVALQTAKQDLRFYREEVNTARLGMLADRAACYEPYNLVIIGDVDVHRVAPPVQRMLEHYVRTGGVLVLWTGAHAPALRDTWVEALAGVKIGPAQPMTGAELAAAAFEDAAARAGARATRSGQVARLKPALDGLQMRGDEVVLAARRPLGSGHVVTLAVDAASHVLQDCAGFHALWAELCRENGLESGPNYDGAFEFYASNLPFASGLKLFEKSAVAVYLALYLLVGVLGNWLVCNALKRRELAWVMLVVFSLLFTAYAMVYGTAGRTRFTQTQETAVVEVPVGGGPSAVRTMASVMAARTSKYDIAFESATGLARDLSTNQILMGNVDARAPAPFVLDEGPSPAIAGLAVGASELRAVEAFGVADVPGGFEGRVRLLGSNGVEGSLTNRTGYGVKSGYVVAGGCRFPVTERGGVFEVKEGQQAQYLLEEGSERQGWGPHGYAYRDNPGVLREDLIRALFTDSNERAPLSIERPYFVGWAHDAPLTTLTFPGHEARTQRKTLIVAALDFEDLAAEEEVGPRTAWLPTSVNEGLPRVFTPENAEARLDRLEALPIHRGSLEIAGCAFLTRRQARALPRSLDVTVLWQCYGRNERELENFRVQPAREAGVEWPEPKLSPGANGWAVYQIDDLAPLKTDNPQRLHMPLVAEGHEENRGLMANVALCVSAVFDPEDETEGVWVPWQ